MAIKKRDMAIKKKDIYSNFLNLIKINYKLKNININ